MELFFGVWRGNRVGTRYSISLQGVGMRLSGQAPQA
jgi:hypothetical protein